MKFKKEYLILAVVICALSAYLVSKRSNRMNYALPTVPTVEKKGITALTLEKDGTRVELTRKDESWYIKPGGFLADTGKVDSMLGAMEGFKLTTLVSESGDYIRYELDDEKKVTVTALKGTDKLLKFDVGRTAPTFKHTFVMIEGDKKVYQARGNFRGDFEKDADELRDKKVLSFEEASITGLTIVEGEKSVDLTLEKPEKAGDEKGKGEEDKVAAPESETPKWVDGEGREVPENAVSSFYSPLSGLECENYINGKKKEDFKDPVLSVTLKGDKSLTLAVFEKSGEEDTGYPAVSSENEYPFILQDYRVENLKRAAGEIRGEKSEE